MTISKLYSVGEVATILKISQRTLFTHIKNHTIKADKLGKYWRIEQNELTHIIDYGTRKYH